MVLIDVTIGQLIEFTKIIKTPMNIEFDHKPTFVDILCKLDEMYYDKIEFARKNHVRDFLDDKIYSLLQLIWNPKTKSFYEDVGVEAREKPPESNMIKIRKEWDAKLPDQSWIILTPDAGC